MARGDLAAALTGALTPAIASLLESFGSTARVRRPELGRDAAKHARVTGYVDATPARVACALSGLAAERAVQVYGPEPVAVREGVALASAGLQRDDVLVIERGPFAGEQLRVVGFGDEVPIAGVVVVGLALHLEEVGL